jgi:hypothetical protein
MAEYLPMIREPEYAGFRIIISSLPRFWSDWRKQHDERVLERIRAVGVAPTQPALGHIRPAPPPAEWSAWISGRSRTRPAKRSKRSCCQCSSLRPNAASRWQPLGRGQRLLCQHRSFRASFSNPSLCCERSLAYVIAVGLVVPRQ